jgi:hypothetical protein
MTCYAGYAFLKWKYTDPVFKSRIEFVCYKCSECFIVQNIYNKDYDFQDDYRQECKAEGYCGAGTEGACTSKCTDCVTGKAGVGSLQQWLHQPAECTACDPGKYAPNKKMTLCKDCDSGNVSGTGWDHCDPCAEGKYKKSASECEDCPAGEANPSKAQVSCFACEKGQYSDKTGLKNCETCEAGKFQDEKGKTTCRKCGVGSFQDISDKQNVLLVLLARMLTKKDLLYVKNVQRAKALMMESQFVQIVSQANILYKEAFAMIVIITQSLLLELPNALHVKQANFPMLETQNVRLVQQVSI